MDAEPLTTDLDARQAAEDAARSSYGRLVALLAAPTGDLALAEDALAEAFEQALRTWPDRGLPANPDGWLLTVARNRQRDAWKSAAHRRTAPLEHATDRGLDADAPLADLDLDALPDRRLALMLVCAHPAIAAPARAPLMLQTVLGIDSAAIAQAFAVAPGAMQQRLVRAKRRIKDARIPFVVPGRTELSERLPALLEAVYACHAVGFAEPHATDPRADTLAREAYHLAGTVADALDDAPEARGLAALVTLSLARAGGRSAQRFVPLADQDPARWDPELLAEGGEHLRRAERPGAAPGRFQLEAAIQAVHADRARTGRTDWDALLRLHRALAAVAPSLGGSIAYAAVVAESTGPDAGLEILEGLPAERERLQTFHAVRADLSARAGRPEEARAAYDRAIDLSTAKVIAEELRRRRSAVG